MSIGFYELLDALRSRPALYISPVSITALYNFLHGYLKATGSETIKDTEPPWMEFNNWVAMRVGFHESTSGWRHMLLSAEDGTEEKAFDRFFILLDEFKGRVARVILLANLPTPSTPKVWRIKIQGDSRTEVPPPAMIQIIRYTDEKGVFIRYCDEDGATIEEEYAWDLSIAYMRTESLVKRDEWQRISDS